MLFNKRKCYKKIISRFWHVLAFCWQKTAKIDKKWRKLAKSKPFDEIFWNLVCRCFPTKKCYKKTFWISAFFGRFLTKKQPKLTKNEENWLNPNRLVKFFEIWYLDASQQKKMLQKNYFSISAFFCHFLSKNSQNWPKWRKGWKRIKTAKNTILFYFKLVIHLTNCLLVPGCKPTGPIDSPLCVCASVRLCIR